MSEHTLFRRKDVYYMTKEQINEFAMRVSQTNRTGLVVIIYEIIDNYIDSALTALENDDIEVFSFNINKSRQFLNQLSSGLDFKYNISYELMNLYMFANDCLIQSEVKRQNINLLVVQNILNKLKNAFEQLSTNDESGMVMRNSQVVYEGLTYGKNARNNVNVTGRTY